MPQTPSNTVIPNLSGGSGGHSIEDEGIATLIRTILNFVGAGVTVTDIGGKIGTWIVEGSIINYSATRRKHFRGYCSYTLTGGASGHFNGTLSSAGRWVNLVNQITQIELISIPGAGTHEAGCRMIVWGHD